MYCVNCGLFLQHGDQFCGQCGTRAADPQRVATSQQRYESIDSYRSARQFPSSPDRHTSGIPRPPQASTTSEVPHQLFLVIGVAQLVAVLVFLIKYWSELDSWGGSLGELVRYALPFAIGDLILVAPILVIGISKNSANNTTLLSVSVIVSLVQSLRTIPSIVERGLTFDFYNIGFTSSATTFLPSSILAASTLFVIPLALLRLRLGSWVVESPSEWWRASLGFFAGLLLIIEDPGRVLYETWSPTGFVLLLAITASGFLIDRVALGAFFGLGIAIGGSMITFAVYWALSSGERYLFSVVSLPSVIALALCVIGVVSTAQRSSTVPRVVTNQRVAR